MPHHGLVERRGGEHALELRHQPIQTEAVQGRGRHHQRRHLGRRGRGRRLHLHRLRPVGPAASILGSGRGRRAGAAAAERHVLAPQVTVGPHARRLGLVDLGEVLAALGSVGVVGDRAEDDREAWLVARLVGVHRHGVLVTRALHLGLALVELGPLHEAAVVVGGDVRKRARCELLRRCHLVALRVNQLKLARVAERDVYEEALLDLVGVRRRAVRVLVGARLLVADDQAVVEAVGALEAKVGIELRAERLQNRRHRLAGVIKGVELHPLVVRAAASLVEEVELGLGCLEARLTTLDALLAGAVVDLEAHVVSAPLEQLLLLLGRQVPWVVARAAGPEGLRRHVAPIHLPHGRRRLHLHGLRRVGRLAHHQRPRLARSQALRR
eukprot:scaffold83539_cov64-Phaeocystis_antarctica.AAC.3